MVSIRKFRGNLEKLENIKNVKGLVICNEKIFCDIKLKKCPFCGGEAHFVKTSIAEYVQCTKCKAEAGVISSFKEAAEAWNRRIGEQNERE